MQHLLFVIYGVFIVYTVFITLLNFCLPYSYSDSFYKLNEKVNGLGYLFSVFMFFIGISTAMVWFDVTNEDQYQFLIFISCGSLIGVGAAPMFKGKDSKAHTYFALVSAFTSLLWVALVIPFSSIFIGPLIFLSILLIMITAVYWEKRIFLMELWTFIILFSSLLKLVSIKYSL